MEHTKGMGNIKLGTTDTRKKYDPMNPDPEQTVNIVDLWLAANPASEEERDYGLGMSTLAPKIANSNLMVGFEEEVAEMSRYGSQEEFNESFRTHDYFADSPLISDRERFNERMERVKIGTHNLFQGEQTIRTPVREHVEALVEKAIGKQKISIDSGEKRPAFELDSFEM